MLELLIELFADYTDVMTITETLVTQGAQGALGTTIVSIGDEKVDLARPWPRAKMTELTSEALGEGPPVHAGGAPATWPTPAASCGWSTGARGSSSKSLRGHGGRRPARCS